MEAAAAGEIESLAADAPARRAHAALRVGQVVGVKDHQRPARAHRLASGETALEAAIGELGVGRPVVGERPAEGLAIEALAARDVGDIELDVVDLVVVAGGAHAYLPRISKKTASSPIRVAAS